MFRYERPDWFHLGTTPGSHAPNFEAGFVFSLFSLISACVIQACLGGSLLFVIVLAFSTAIIDGKELFTWQTARVLGPLLVFIVMIHVQCLAIIWFCYSKVLRDHVGCEEAKSAIFISIVGGIMAFIFSFALIAFFAPS